MDTDTELPELFYRLCPSAKNEAEAIRQIIQNVHSQALAYKNIKIFLLTIKSDIKNRIK